MPIDITIIKSPKNVNNGETSLTFPKSGGSLGRGLDNTWVLDDPDKYMSSLHTRVSFENGQYILTDLSTNGTFVNGSSESVGNGNKVKLAEGDRFSISDYEFIVNIRSTSQGSNDLFSQSMDQGPFSGMNTSGSTNNGGGAIDPFLQADPFAAPANNYVPLSDAMSGFDALETDPLVALDKAKLNSSQSSSLVSRSVADHGNAMNDSVDWPTSNLEPGVIPDDWDDDLPGKSNASPAYVIAPDEMPSNNLPGNGFTDEETLAKLEGENKKLTHDIAELKKQLEKQSSSVGVGVGAEGKEERLSHALMSKTLMESLGFSGRNLDDDKVAEISETTGLLVREMMEGMMQVLRFRKKIKEEFRINVTTIQPVENNPLKFSANIEDAMENMFIKKNNAYKEPLEAVREGFQGISEHQLAVLAGMQAAFRGMLERFDPDALENRFEKYKQSSLIKIGKNRKTWDSYKAYHAELAANLDNSFQHLFGYDFVQAYEEQMQRLVVARKENTDKK